jgi:hypothetical protein
VEVIDLAATRVQSSTPQSLNSRCHVRQIFSLLKSLTPSPRRWNRTKSCFDSADLKNLIMRVSAHPKAKTVRHDYRGLCVFDLCKCGKNILQKCSFRLIIQLFTGLDISSYANRKVSLYKSATFATLSLLYALAANVGKIIIIIIF